MRSDDGKFINAGTIDIYRWGKKAQEKVAQYLVPNETGFYAIPVNGHKYYDIGTSEGKFGEFAKYRDTFFSVNSYGYLWAKVGTPKADVFVQMINGMIEYMKSLMNKPEEDYED